MCQEFTRVKSLTASGGCAVDSAEDTRGFPWTSANRRRYRVKRRTERPLMGVIRRLGRRCRVQSLIGTDPLA